TPHGDARHMHPPERKAGSSVTDTTTEKTSVAGLVQQISKQADLPLEQAIPLPTRTYWDPEFYEHELTHIFRKDWVCIARVEQTPERGSYVSVDLAGEPLIVVRGDDDEVRVFSRVCRHRYVDILGGKNSDE